MLGTSGRDKAHNGAPRDARVPGLTAELLYVPVVVRLRRSAACLFFLQSSEPHGYLPVPQQAGSCHPHRRQAQLPTGRFTSAAHSF